MGAGCRPSIPHLASPRIRTTKKDAIKSKMEVNPHYTINYPQYFKQIYEG